MEYEDIRTNRVFRIALAVQLVFALICAGAGKMYQGHTDGTVIDSAFLETVRQIVIHERMAVFGTIVAICTGLAMLFVFAADVDQSRYLRTKWAAIICLITGMAFTFHLAFGVLPMNFKTVRVSKENRIEDLPQSQRSNKQPLVNSSDALVRSVDKETQNGSQQPYYMVYCGSQIIRMYSIDKYELSDELKEQ